MPQDLILRERVQFTLDAQGDQTTVYGRIDLDDFVSITKREGILIKECYIMPKFQESGALGLSNTGVFSPIVNQLPTIGGVSISVWGAMKIYLTTTAYENAIDVGIASPNVLHLETWSNVIMENAATATAGRGIALWANHERYSLQDLHQGEYPVITDVLVGLAVDNFDILDLEVFEVDVVLIAETTKITPTQLTTMLTQAQDL